MGPLGRIVRASRTRLERAMDDALNLQKALFSNRSRIMNQMSNDSVTGLNIMKSGQDPPLEKDENLPEWLWKLADTPKTLAELQRLNPAELTLEEAKYKKKLENRRNIKMSNSQKEK